MMPNRLYSSMTAHQFKDWCERHDVREERAKASITSISCLDALGISHTQFYKYRNGRIRIPETIRIACDLRDKLLAYRAHAVTVRDLADIAAHNK